MHGQEGQVAPNHTQKKSMRLRRKKHQLCCDYAASPKQTSTYVNFVAVACLQLAGGWWGGMMTELFSCSKAFAK